MKIYPAIDLLDGKAVRLRQGRYEEVTVYSDDPAALAASWRPLVGHLHLVDLEGSRSGGTAQSDLVARIVKAFGGGVQVGGGIRTLDAIHAYFALGVDRVVLGTVALTNPELLEQAALAYPNRIVVAVDARNGKVATKGWLEQSERTAVDVVRSFAQFPIAAALYTDIERDGTEVGPNVKETAALATDCGMPVIASGGVGTLEHIRALVSAHAGITAAIVGRALHEGRFSLQAAVQAAESLASD